MGNDGNEDYKARVKAATEKYLTKNDPNKVHRKNEEPERELQKEVIKWLNSIGWDVDSIDSKAQFSEGQGRYISQNAKPGISDVVGNDPNGIAVYIEMKAPGRRSSLRHNQRLFLLRKIKTNCFAIVADSKEFISTAYKRWSLDYADRAKRNAILLSLLPPEKTERDQGSLFD